MSLWSKNKNTRSFTLLEALKKIKNLKMIQQTINIKPLSVNDCWQGRRFKTKEYKIYEKEMKLKIKKQKMPVAPYNIELKLYLSNPLSDIDNPIKPILDILQKKLGFNDRLIDKLTVEKIRVEKGKEKICFLITELIILK